jgi:hypothetical protein
LAYDEVNQDMEKGTEEVRVGQDKTQGKKLEVRIDAGSSSRQQQNRTVLVCQTKTSGFSRIRTEDFKDHHAWYSTNISLVSIRIYTQPQEKDPKDEGT